MQSAELFEHELRRRADTHLTGGDDDDANAALAQCRPCRARKAAKQVDVQGLRELRTPGLGQAPDKSSPWTLRNTRQGPCLQGP